MVGSGTSVAGATCPGVDPFVRVEPGAGAGSTPGEPLGTRLLDPLLLDPLLPGTRPLELSGDRARGVVPCPRDAA